jgi:hypothetical protein
MINEFENNDAQTNPLLPPNETREEGNVVFKSNTQLRKFFTQPNYLSVLRNIFVGIKPQTKKQMYTNVNKMYVSAVKTRQEITSVPENLMKLKILKNISENVFAVANACNCDSFFNAIANSINSFNSIINNNINKNINKTSSQDLIIYRPKPGDNSYSYGENLLFSQVVIRTMLFNAIFHSDLPEELLFNTLLDKVVQNVELLNEQFKKHPSIQSSNIDEDTYLKIVNLIFSNNKCKTFLVSKVSRIPETNDMYLNPFSIIKEKNRIQHYIFSEDCCANELVIPYIEHSLQVAIITTSVEQNNIYMSYSANNVRFPKFLFLFFLKEQCCYQQIKFNWYESPSSQNISIFKADDMQKMPPFSMLLLLYGSYYYRLTSEEKKQVFLLKEQLETIDAVYEKIKDTKDSSERNIVTLFNVLFPDRNVGIVGGIVGGLVGGKKNRLLQIKQNAIQTRKNRKIQIQIQKGGQHHEGDHDHSKLSYFVNIELYVYENDGKTPPGNIPFSVKSSLYCNQNTNQLREAISELFGTKYTPKIQYSPDYKGYQPPTKHSDKHPHHQPQKGGGINKHLLTIKERAIKNKITRKKRTIL